MSLPPFTEQGLLPVGDHPLALEQLRASHLVTGEHRRVETWDRDWRARLVDNLELLIRELWEVHDRGVRIGRVVIDGSFVEEKPHPNDIDGYFECRLVDYHLRRLENGLNALNPHKIWTWDTMSRRRDPDSGRWKLPMWHQYRIELFPVYFEVPEMSSGISDASGRPMSWEDAFRVRRGDYRRKGIVEIIRETGDAPASTGAGKGDSREDDSQRIGVSAGAAAPGAGSPGRRRAAQSAGKRRATPG